MKRTKTNKNITLSGPVVETEVVMDNTSHSMEVAKETVDGVFNTVNVVAGAVASMAEAERMKSVAQIAENQAMVEAAAIASDYRLRQQENQDIHEEITKHQDNVEKIVDSVLSSHENVNDPQLMMRMMDMLDNSVVGTVLTRTNKKNN